MQKQLKYRLLLNVAVLLSATMILKPVVSAALNSDRWSFVMLAVASAVLLGFFLDEKPPQKRKPHSYAFITLLLGVAVWLIGVIGNIQYFQYVAATLFISSVLINWSKAASLNLLAMIFCLILLVPLPGSLEVLVGPSLAQYEATIFVQIAQLMGLNVYQIGTQIVSGDAAVTINSNCSGTLLLWPALLGFVVAATSKEQSPTRWAVVVLAAVPFAILFNLIRLTILIVLNLGEVEKLADSFHDMLGWMATCAVWLIPVMWGLGSRSFKFSKAEFTKISHVGLPLVALVAGYFIPVSQVTVLKHSDLENVTAFIPVFHKGWTGKDIKVSDEEAGILAADYVVRRFYFGPSGERQAMVTLSFHQDITRGRLHNSLKCYKAMGWRVYKSRTASLSKTAKVSDLYMQAHQSKQAVIEIEYIQKETHDSKPRGFYRLQIVEESDISFEERYVLAETFFALLKAKKGTEI